MQSVLDIIESVLAQQTHIPESIQCTMRHLAEIRHSKWHYELQALAFCIYNFATDASMYALRFNINSEANVVKKVAAAQAQFRKIMDHLLRNDGSATPKIAWTNLQLVQPILQASTEMARYIGVAHRIKWMRTVQQRNKPFASALAYERAMRKEIEQFDTRYAALCNKYGIVKYQKSLFKTWQNIAFANILIQIKIS